MKLVTARFLRLLWRRPGFSLHLLPPSGAHRLIQPATCLPSWHRYYSADAGMIDSFLGSMNVIKKKTLVREDDVPEDCASPVSEDIDTYTNPLDSGKKFSDFPISPWIVRKLEKLGFTTAFDVQEKTLPLTLNGRDVIVRAVTGSGKTLAFAVPIIHILSNSRATRNPRAIVITPTRELCIQVSTCIQSLSDRVTCVSLYGGSAYGPQERALYRGVDVICATPGRLNDHLERGNFGLSDVKFLILDEGDELLTPNFKEQIKTFLEDCPEEKQMMLFSATMPRDIKQLTKMYMRDPVMVNLVSNKSLIPANITHEAIRVDHYKKGGVVANLLLYHKPERTIVFTTTKAQSAQMSRMLNQLGVESHYINSDLSQSAREACLQSFRDGKTSVLVATDVAARGIDVPETDLVIQVDPPPNGVDFYIHRAGRTGRKGQPGRAIILYSDSDRFFMKELERIVDLKYSSPPDNTEVIRGAIQATVKAAKEVDPKMLQLTMKQAHELYEEKGIEALAATLVLSASIQHLAAHSSQSEPSRRSDGFSRRSNGNSRRGDRYSSGGYSRFDDRDSRRSGRYSSRRGGYSRHNSDRYPENW